ncbi:Flagellar motor switch protein FliG [Methylocella tundrae]|jgi:flagellar motor switch protein FliG|uniref:Flagellar motor switch protein FliG n=1 Tax=Methylocella tundrae TaxID=227605 RepID=A0A4U8YVJ2_METTU|nr:FliG C-terminal domain-containing protein [Methylocella tundrae]WPP04720.1 FliG C-terminal domain-containing protein [Methylocella tundrae]VFU06916.1 Flagellar motor switch protein FliG [Methylocella tundrae]VTZ24657.1 Flagellar motor switch protein FliG [Methylocella tundrae]VTZ50026.1 Flagellar motor switch protein FliG [Methylocella tundrae]
MAASIAQASGVSQRFLRGPERVAALLLAMGKPLASRLLKHFDVDELKQITRSVAELGVVPAPTLELLVEDFASQFANGVDLLGSPNEVEQMLDGVLSPEQIADVMSDVTGNSNEAMWERLSNVPEGTLGAYLAKEHPQAAALILSKVTPVCAAKVMGQFPRDLRNEMMRRMLSIGQVTEAAVRIIQGQLQEDLLSNLSRQNGSEQNVRIANIINKMERDQMEDVMQSLAAARPKAAEVLRGLMFTFDDIIKLQPKARSVLFDKIPTELVVLALKGTDAGFRDSILSSLAARARRIVDSELANGGPALQRDVLKARRMIADTALELSSNGEIELNSSEDEDELYE